MIDWNRNGTIGPVDVGVSVGINEAAADNQPANDETLKKPTGCLAFCLIVIASATSAIVGVWRLIV